jgi:hypothetical protein
MGLISHRERKARLRNRQVWTRLSEDQYERFRQKALADGSDRSAVLRGLIASYIDGPHASPQSDLEVLIDLVQALRTDHLSALELEEEEKVALSRESESIASGESAGFRLRWQQRKECEEAFGNDE